MKRNVLGGLAAICVAVSVGVVPANAVTTQVASGPGDPEGPSPRALAASSASALVASRAPQLKVSAGEAFIAKRVMSGARGLQYTPYQRTYRGLEVHGGDFVVASDSKGRIVGTSVAQTKKIGALSLTAKVSAAAAQRTAQGTVDSARRVGTPEKVVDAIGTPGLAWKVQVSGSSADGDFEIKDVYVDAVTGAVRSQVSRVHFADDNSRYNGLVDIPTTSSGGTFSLKSPNIANLDCRTSTSGARPGAVLTGPDDTWGNGAHNVETGCVDSLYAVETEQRMLVDWLGGTSMKNNAAATAWPVNVGYDTVNAFYCPPGLNEAGYCDGTEKVEIGHNQAGDKWLSAIDVLAHEYGHGIDTNTPGGISRGQTSEFVADVFGALTEAYANESAQYDEPDYTVGEEVDLQGSGPFRTMYKPSVNGDPDCYSSSIPSTEVHAAAGPGNHWFYLLAEGTNPVGKPTSPTCNGSSNLAGIGIRDAGKIFYNAMLLKTSSSSYLKYRTWTLTAAKNLYPGSCTNFNKVKAAWDAVSVPAQAGDPTCSVAGNTVTVTNPGARSGTVGTATSLQMTGTSTGAGQTLTWAATGLPAGLSINATTGLISGTPTTAQTTNVTVTAKDTTNAQGSTSFTWTITGGGGGGWTPTLANTIALNNCSASLVRFPTSQDGDKALMLSNGHCIESGMPNAGQVIKDQPSSKAGTLLKGDGSSAGTVTAERLLYATMTDTDVSLYRLNETFAALKARTGGTPFTIATAKPAIGTPVAVSSGYHKRIWNCSVDGYANLREGQWSWKDSIRYTQPGCEVIGGSSGSPLVSKTTGEVVGANNTTNENGEMCTVNNPCEVAADGTTTAKQGNSYAQETFWFTTCVNANRVLDLTVSGCKLPGASTPPPPQNTVTVTNPGAQSAVVGTAYSKQITGASSGGGSLTYSATGLPAGLTISSSGLISGTPTTAATSTVVVTGKDSTNASGSTSFSFTVSSVPNPPSGNLLKNPGFESGKVDWVPADVVTTNSTYPARTGTWKAWLGGWGSTATETLGQSVTIPANVTRATLSFWIRIDTDESGTTAYDTTKLQVVNGSTTSTLATYSNANATTGYVQKTLDLSAYKGRTVTLKFVMNEDYSLQTSFVLDDLSLTVS